jgi:hypothetical protein
VWFGENFKLSFYPTRIALNMAKDYKIKSYDRYDEQGHRVRLN